MFEPTRPPRVFRVGRSGSIELRDCGRVKLGADDQVTFVTESGAELDVVRKAWGFYATPSTNGRLRRHGLRASLVRGADGKAFILLVEDGNEAAFETYLRDEDLRIVSWLDTDAHLEALEGRGASAPLPTVGACVCGGRDLELWHTYREAPAGEIRFAFTRSTAYARTLWRCRACDHVQSRHSMDEGTLYGGEYVDANYRDADGLRRQFERITALDPSKSDNVGRVRRVLAFAEAHHAGRAGVRRTLLDVGSGLGVFVHRMKEAGWECTALDPDVRAARHAREVVGVDSIAADFRSVTKLGTFDVVTLNKVLEHIPDPVPMLAKARECLDPQGFVYIEVPDVAAAREGPGREEFFIDHHHVFSPASIAIVIARAGLTPVTIERIRDPSGKYTLRAFAVPPT